LENIWQKNTPSPFSNKEWRWGLGFNNLFLIRNVLHYTLLNPIMWNVASITTNLISRIGVGLRFTYKSRSINDNFLFHFNSSSFATTFTCWLSIVTILWRLSFFRNMPSYNKNTQILKQQSIQKNKTKAWISPTIAIATTTQELQAPLNKEL
jgi:hypothetical protein